MYVCWQISSAINRRSEYTDSSSKFGVDTQSYRESQEYNLYIMVDKGKKYLCAAPRPSTWEEKAEALLKSLGGDPKKRETVLRQTLSALKER